MCLIAIAWQAHARYRLALIANRDEFHGRPTAAAGFDPGQADVYGGRDLQAGGGWLMVSARGRMAAVTNVRDGLQPGTAALSRGQLVREFVTGDATALAHAASLAQDASRYGRYNLVLWDGDDLHFASNHPRFSTHAVAPGVHAMSNGAFDARWPKAMHSTAVLSQWLVQAPVAGDAGDPAPSALFEAMADTTQAPDALLPDTGVGIDLERRLSPPFVRGSDYGTRCSSVVLVEDGRIGFAERRYGPDAVVLDESQAWLNRS